MHSKDIVYSCLATTVAATASLWCNSVNAQAAINRYLTVGANAAVMVGGQTTIYNNQTDSVFSGANTLVQDDVDGPGAGGDYPCPHTFIRNGNVQRIFEVSDGTNTFNRYEWQDIDTPDELNAVLSQSPYIKITETITYCGESATPPFVFIGCSRWNTSVLRRDAFFGTDASGLLAHEFGHTVGLDDDYSNTTRIMYWLPTSGRHHLTQSQCSAYVTPNLSSNGGPAGAMAEGSPDYSDIPIKELAIHGFYNHVPLDVDLYYDQGDVELLKDMLINPTHSSSWQTVAGLIGLISDGNDDDVEALVAFGSSAGRKRGDKVAVGIGLGYLATRTGSQKALQHLVRFARSRNRADVKAAVLGLGVSDKPEARAELERIAKSLDPRREPTSADDLTPSNLDGALKTHDAIVRMGLHEAAKRRR